MFLAIRQDVKNRKISFPINWPECDISWNRNVHRIEIRADPIPTDNLCSDCMGNVVLKLAVFEVRNLGAEFV